jgi:hypothetical protein
VGFFARHGVSRRSKSIVASDLLVNAGLGLGREKDETMAAESRTNLGPVIN